MNKEPLSIGSSHPSMLATNSNASIQLYQNHLEKILAATGVFFSVKFGRKISITHLLLVNSWAMAVLTYGHPRFLVPLLPSLFILAAYAADSLLKMDRKAFGIVMGLILSVNLLIAIWFPQIRAFVEGPLKTMLLR